MFGMHLCTSAPPSLAHEGRASVAVLGGISDSVFTDDAIRIEKYYDQYRMKPDLKGLDIDTQGAITVHINSNRDGNGRNYENWLDYAVKW